MCALPVGIHKFLISIYFERKLLRKTPFKSALYQSQSHVIYEVNRPFQNFSKSCNVSKAYLHSEAVLPALPFSAYIIHPLLLLNSMLFPPLSSATLYDSVLPWRLPLAETCITLGSSVMNHHDVESVALPLHMSYHMPENIGHSHFSF